MREEEEGGGQENSQKKFPRPYVRTYRTLHFYFYFGKRGHSTTHTKRCPRFSEKNAESTVRGVRAYGRNKKNYFGTSVDPVHLIYIFILENADIIINYVYPSHRRVHLCPHVHRVCDNLGLVLCIWAPWSWLRFVPPDTHIRQLTSLLRCLQHCLTNIVLSAFACYVVDMQNEFTVWAQDANTIFNNWNQKA